LKIVGEGPLKSGLIKLCENLGLSGVEFLGWKTGPELVRLYQKARVVAIPSIYEPFGMTALESLACQRPVVASNIGGLPEIIKDSGAGYLVQRNDELDLAQGLMTLLHDSKRRNEMGEAGRKHAFNNGYMWPEIAQRFVGLYKGLLGKPLDLNIPDGAEDFKVQIKSVSKEMAAVPTSGELDSLFKWMEVKS